MSDTKRASKPKAERERYMSPERFEQLGAIWDEFSRDRKNDSGADDFDANFLNGAAVLELLNEAEVAILARDIVRRHYACGSDNCAHWHDLRKALQA